MLIEISAGEAASRVWWTFTSVWVSATKLEPAWSVSVCTNVPSLCWVWKERLPILTNGERRAVRDHGQGLVLSYNTASAPSPPCLNRAGEAPPASLQKRLSMRRLAFLSHILRGGVSRVQLLALHQGHNHTSERVDFKGGHAGWTELLPWPAAVLVGP